MKKMVKKETVVWSIFLIHSVIIFSLFIFYAYKGFDKEEFNEFFWYLYPLLLFWGYQAYKTLIYKENLNLPLRVLKIILFLIAVLYLCTVVKALAPCIVNFSELKSITLFIEFLVCVYLFSAIIISSILEEYKLTENGL